MCIENIACLRFVAFREEIAHSELVSVARASEGCWRSEGREIGPMGRR